MLKNVLTSSIAALGAVLFMFAPGEYWWLVGASVFEVAWLLLLLVIIPFMKVPRRGQLASLAVTALMAGLGAMALMGIVQWNDLISRLDEAWGVWPFIGSRLWAAFWGTIIAAVVSSIFLFFVGYFSSIYIVGLHEEEVGFWDAFKSFVFLVLDVNLAWLLVEDGDIHELKKQGFVNKWLSRGKIIIKPGNAIVTEKGGAITDIRGSGVKLTVKDERIREVFDLRPQVAIKTVENVLTADQIPLEVELGIGYKITPFKEGQKVIASKNGNNNKQKDDNVKVHENKQGCLTKFLAGGSAEDEDGKPKIFKEKKYGLFPVSEATLMRAAFNGTGGGWQGFGDNAPIGQLRDQIMAHDFNELFRIVTKDDDLAIRVDQRQVKRIEDAILEKLNGFADDAIGLTYNFIDIREIHFPDEIRRKLTKELTTLVDERITQTEAKSIVAKARAEAQAKILEGQGEGEAKAAYFREVLHELRKVETVGDVKIDSFILSQLIGTLVSVQDLKAFVRASALLEQSTPKRLRAGVETENGNGKERVDSSES